ncbi:hypothetical protein Poli38472_011593 [Pythium oligandrum]|uniref:Uncharacterized protein n=1 Tax=Pythium oligandrum TaxID=41045 RepID=A0A8K1CKM6_PYTOL|nr:hypothetical protein Poli38472_011593 [Pythium oligandrum]|eukprot:TMW64713.1 hypothetical protein Poli38472_011593 [Pythium oligandrum]
MEGVLTRLWEISDHVSSEPKSYETIVEAQHLWKTLETLIATLKKNEFRVADPVCSRVLACVRAVLAVPRSWRVSAPGSSSSPGAKSVPALAVQVLLKLAVRGEEERAVVVLEGFVDLLVQMLASKTVDLSTMEAVSVLNAFQAIAADSKSRAQLLQSKTVPAAVMSMRHFNLELVVLVASCKFLQLMASESDGRRQIADEEAIFVILSAANRYGNDTTMALSASDLFHSLSLDFRSNEASSEPAVQGIIEMIVKVMRRHSQLRQIQAFGVATLRNLVVADDVARQFLCEYSCQVIWEITGCAFEASSDATTDTTELLESLLSDPICYEYLQTTLRINATPQEAKDQMRMLQGLSDLIPRLEDKQNQSIHEHTAQEIAFVIEQMQKLMRSSSHVDTPASPDRNSLLEYDQEEEEISIPAIKIVHSVDKMASMVPQKRVVFADLDDDDSHRYLDEDSPVGTSGRLSKGSRDEERRWNGQQSPRIEGNSPHSDSSRSRSAFCIKSPNVGLPVQRSSKGAWESSNASSPCRKSPSKESTVSESTYWQRLYESRHWEFQELQGEYRLLQESYKLVLRRAQEQSKLLNIQNARIKHHIDVHQLMLAKTKDLEIAVEDAKRKHQVERELRLAEVAQADKLSYSLQEAMQEIRTLNSNNSTTSRELVQREKLRLDSQQRATEIKQQKQQAEYERDDALGQIRAIQTETVELSKQLHETRREALETLQMREEDVNAPRPSIFSEIIRNSPTSRSRKLSNYTLTTKRVSTNRQQQRKSMYAGSFTNAIRPVDASVFRKASVSGGDMLECASLSSSKLVHADDDEIEPPKDDFSELHSQILVGTNPRGLNADEIEQQLQIAYESLETSLEGNGVHLATVRKFFQESGIVEPPVVAGDVDTILTKVLNQAQDNRRRSMPRKDFTLAQPLGKSSFSTEAKRLRYFDLATFYEAATLMSLRRFPRCDAKAALELFVLDYLLPMQSRRARRSSNVSGTASSMISSRSGSICSNGGSGGASSPTAIGIGVLKAVLNGLALHVGHNPDIEDDQHSQRHQHVFRQRKNKREDVIYSMVEMQTVLAREYKPLATICEFYSAMHHTPRDALLKDDSTCLPLSFELVLTFAVDFEIIPSFMDRLSLKHLYAEVGGYLKMYFASSSHMPNRKGTLAATCSDPETLKKVALSMMLARLAMELFGTRHEYETPEKQITALLQWLDNSVGREKIQKKAMLPIVIRFSRKLYAIK